MFYISKTPNPSGAYPPLQDVKADGLLAFPDEFVPVFYPGDQQCAGFVTIEDDGESVTSCVWNEELYQAWMGEQAATVTSQLPPTELEQLRADIDYIAMETGVEL